MFTDYLRKIMPTKLLSQDSDFFNKTFFSKKAFTLVLLFTIVGFILRIYRLSFLSLWVDEYVYTRILQNVLEGSGNIGSNKHGLIYMLIALPFVKIWGMSEFWLRLPAVIFGAGCIPLIYLLGKRLFNKTIGLLSAFLGMISLYSIYWSRVVRNYSSFEFFYLLLILAFLYAYEYQSDKKDTFWNKHKLNKKFLILFPIALGVSILNHQLSVFFLFSLLAYSSIMFVVNFLTKKFPILKNKYSIIAIPGLIFFILLLTPFALENVIRPFFLIILPEKAVNFIIPNWERILGFIEDPEKRFFVFDVYFNVLTYDFTILHYLGFLGLISAFLFNRKAVAFFFAFFVFPFLLMSFIFREPYLPRYLIYIYPIFIIAIAVGIMSIVKGIVHFLPNKNNSGFIPNILTLLVFIVTYFLSPHKEVMAMIKTEQHGRIIPKELSNWSFTDWKQPLAFVKKHIRPSDKIISTVSVAPSYYLNRDDVIHFRQRKYDTKKKQYVPMDDCKEGQECAYSVNGFMNIVKSNKRGWLIADYYFDNVMTDPRAKDFAIKNLDYYFNLSVDGSVKVFSWDHDIPRKHRNTVLIELGKGAKMASNEMNFSISNLQDVQNPQLRIESEGIDGKDEAFAIINKKHQVLIPPNDALGRSYSVTPIDKSWLKQGQNTLQFGYNQKTKDFFKGYVIYNISL